MSVRVARPRKGKCIICDLPTEQRQEINAVMWDGGQRTRSYITAARRAHEQLTGRKLGRNTVMRHADHTEQAWRDATADDPVAGREEPVFPTDYESLTDKAAALGARAMSELERKVLHNEIEPRELLGVAKMGLGARQSQEQAKRDERRPHIALTALIGIASGHLAQFPEAEVIEVHDEQALKDEVQEERRILAARARGIGD